jgi:eukaryotic-like serine/threonine-protein kinase
MGEVYRARDLRLGREVAIKVLPAAYVSDPDRQDRFQREARAVAALNHPNIVALHDVGTDGNLPFLVSELLEGTTLRERLTPGEPWPVRKALDVILPVAHALAAAHARGIVHRDLKPENVFVGSNGIVKILDFGLARLTESESTSHEATVTGTEAGTVLGTVGYMAPEQVRGLPADHRADIFAFGAILYEMLAGRRAFAGDTAADTISAILTKEPPEMLDAAHALPAALERTVRRCLEKRPESRFQSASDLAFAIQALSDIPPSALLRASEVEQSWTRVFRSNWRRVAAVIALLVLASGIGAWASHEYWVRPLPNFRQLTFRRGVILNARFTPDGATVFYSATWDGEPPEIFSIRADGTESQPLGLPAARLLSVSTRGELAILLTRPGDVSARASGTLARVTPGGAVREVLEDVYSADWSPDGNELAVVRRVGNEIRLEYPIGNTLTRDVVEWVAVRVSPNGDRVAFRRNDAVIAIDRRREETRFFEHECMGIAWFPSGDGLWISASAGEGSPLQIWVTRGANRTREVYRIAGGVGILHDASKDGRLLLHHGFERIGVLARGASEAIERDLSVFQYSVPTFMSPDGAQVLVADLPSAVTFLRTKRGGPPVPVAQGWAIAVSPEGKRALVLARGDPPKLTLTPIGPGETVPVPIQVFAHAGWAWFSGTDRILITAREAEKQERTYLIALPNGTPRPITPEGTVAFRETEHEGWLVAGAADGSLAWYPLGVGAPRSITARLPPGFEVIRASRDGRSLLVYEEGPVPIHVERLDLTTGERVSWKTLRPDDPAGIAGMSSIFVTPDEQAYAYQYGRFLQDLYLVTGLRP